MRERRERREESGGEVCVCVSERERRELIGNDYSNLYELFIFQQDCLFYKLVDLGIRSLTTPYDK
jgi:hypothetical protein